MASYPDDAITKEELIKTVEGRVSGEKEDASWIRQDKKY